MFFLIPWRIREFVFPSLLEKFKILGERIVLQYRQFDLPRLFPFTVHDTISTAGSDPVDIGMPLFRKYQRKFRLYLLFIRSISIIKGIV